MLSLVPACLAFCFAVSSAQILIQGEPVDLPGTLLGGKTDVDDVNREDIKEMADFATSSLSTKKNAAVDLVKVVKAQVQVVSGVNYFLKIQIKPAGCYDNCKYEECDMTIYDQPWTKTREVTHSACKEVSPPVGTLGGEKVNVEDPDVMKAVNFAIDEINKKSNSMFRSSFMKLEHGTKQVVEGLLYKLVFVLGDSLCRNNPDKMGSDLKACPLADNTKTQLCHAIVWYRAWKKPQYKLQDWKCDQKQSNST